MTTYTCAQGRELCCCTSIVDAGAPPHPGLPRGWHHATFGPPEHAACQGPSCVGTRAGPKDRRVGFDGAFDRVGDRRKAKPAEDKSPCPGCNRALNWPCESGRWRAYVLHVDGSRSYAKPFRFISSAPDGYQHEHQDQWVDCPGREKEVCPGCGEAVEWRNYPAYGYTHAQPDGAWRDCEGKRENPEPGLVAKYRRAALGSEADRACTFGPDGYLMEAAGALSDLEADLDKAHQVYEQQVARIEALEADQKHIVNDALEITHDLSIAKERLEAQLAEAKRLIGEMAESRWIVHGPPPETVCAFCTRLKTVEHSENCPITEALALGFIEESTNE